MTDYAGWATADFTRMIKAHTSTELLQMLDADRLTHVQRAAIKAELETREV